MNDSLLQMNTFFPNELMAIESIEQDNCTVHIKLRSRTHSCKCQNAVMKQRIITVLICGKYRIFQFLEKQHAFP